MQGVLCGAPQGSWGGWDGWVGLVGAVHSRRVPVGCTVPMPLACAACFEEKPERSGGIARIQFNWWRGCGGGLSLGNGGPGGCSRPRRTL